MKKLILLVLAAAIALGVYLYIQKGGEVPSLSGMNKDDCIAYLEEKGLTIPDSLSFEELKSIISQLELGENVTLPDTQELGEDMMDLYGKLESIVSDYRDK